MCGINGFTGSPNADVLRRMHAATHHRGPDDDGFLEASGISFAHNRLSIIDLSPAGRQPMSTPDGRLTIIFNGEIYNYRELRLELEKLGRRFATQTDTEVLLQAFAEWGDASLKKLNGMFAFALWNRDREELTLARDPVGVKPLYYTERDERVFFSSEIKALLAAGASQNVDSESLNLYFRFLYVPGPRTMFAGIKKLQPGHLLRARGGKIEIKKYHAITEGPYLSDYKSTVEDLRARLRASVTRQLVSDRPLGVFLSGGIDSTSVLALMRDSVGSNNIKTFSVGYEATEEAEKYNSDAMLARRSAQYFGTEHHELTLSGRDVAACFEKIAWQMDEPVSNHIQPSTYLLAKFAKPDITVALGGDGGDELFGGYDRYWRSAFLDRIRALPAPLRHPVVLRFIETLTHRRGLAEKIHTTPGLERFFSFIGQKPDPAARFIRPQFRYADAGEKAFAPYFNRPWSDWTNQLMAVDAETWLVDESLVRTDKLTMAHALEQRVPLLDLELLDLAYRIPSAWKLNRPSQGKRILVDAMRPLLPPHVLSVKKQGFFSPAAKWLRGDLLPLARELLSDTYASGSADLIDLAEARRALEDHVSRRAYGLNPVWAVMTFQAWRREVLGVSSKESTVA